MKIASWNVNSVRARLDHVEDYLRNVSPDVLCLQETKVTDAEFPLESFSRLGYETARVGQKSYNGVALLSKHPIEDVRLGLSPSESTDEARLISGMIQGVRVLSAYIPNGKNLDSPSFKHKLDWLDRLRTTLTELHSHDQALALCGDFNIAKDHRDVFDPEMMEGKIHFSPLERQALAAIEDLGLIDSLRQVTEEAKIFSWWDYRMGAFRRNRGLRIDYIFVSHPVSRGLKTASVDKTPRDWDKPSDHAPCVVEFSLDN
jgi:exodeoxyribonuclease-3